MKHLSLALVALTLMACSNKAAQSIVGGGSTTSAPTEPILKDNAQVADARSQLVEQIKKQRDATMAKLPPEETELRQAVSQSYDSAIQKVARQHASSPEELEAFAIEQYSGAKEQIFQSVRGLMASKSIARINPEPQAGEKREAVDGEGNCTNDLIVDVQQFYLQQLDAMHDIQQIAQSGGPLASVSLKLTASTLMEKCDTIVDRYDPNAVCKFKLPGEEGSEFKATDFKQSCESIREQLSQFN